MGPSAASGFGIGGRSEGSGKGGRLVPAELPEPSASDTTTIGASRVAGEGREDVAVMAGACTAEVSVS